MLSWIPDNYLKDLGQVLRIRFSLNKTHLDKIFLRRHPANRVNEETCPKIPQIPRTKARKKLSSRLKEVIVLSKPKVSLKHKHSVYPSC